MKAALCGKKAEYFTPGKVSTSGTMCRKSKGSQEEDKVQIFEVRWSEPATDRQLQTSGNGKNDTATPDQPVITYWRQMVAIKTNPRQNSSTCV
jgi:hypothetical protein